jgi:hypothetical protein
VGSSRWLRRWLRVLLFAFAACAAVIILYGIVQIFICGLREAAFWPLGGSEEELRRMGLQRRARWLCP